MSIHEENTARALREQELWVTSFWCKFGWHKWLKFREPTEKRVRYDTIHILQERRCGHCNIQNWKKIGEK